MNWKLIQTAPTSTTPVTGSLGSLVVRDPSATVQGFSLAPHRSRLQELSALLDATDPDLSAFQKRGGKLILKVNTTDYTVNPRWVYAYYDRVVSTMGEPAVDGFVRFYVGVGIFHNRNVGRNPITDEVVPGYVDFITMLDDWVETGKPPADAPTLSAMDPVPPFNVRWTVPMCRYPLYAKYRGDGDARTAKNFSCVR
jgi:feruloyl esterase